MGDKHGYVSGDLWGSGYEVNEGGGVRTYVHVAHGFHAAIAAAMTAVVHVARMIHVGVIHCE